MSASAEATSDALDVEELHVQQDLRSACELLASIWGRDSGSAPVVPELLTAISHAGGYVAGVRHAGELIGASMAFLGRDRGEVVLHSHITGIDPQWQGRGIGTVLKRHQQRWAAERGIDAITWTFDPLVRRNGRFNLTVLGAVATAYLPDFYGEMADAINGSDPTDRCVARWAVDATSGRDPSFHDLTARGAEAAVCKHTDGRPVARASRARVRMVEVPEDIVALRRADPQLAHAWRMASREAFAAAFDDGLVGVAVTTDGWFVVAESAEAL